MAAVNMTWSCPRCNGYGQWECGDPHASIMYDCERCQKSGQITSLKGLCEAVHISDPSALELILREPQGQNDLDQALGSVIKLNRIEHVRLLLAADADAQAGLKHCLCEALSKRLSWNNEQVIISNLKVQTDILRLLVESGATVGDEEMEGLEDAFECVEHNGCQDSTKQVLEVFADLLRNAGSKVLSLCVEEVYADSWSIKVYSFVGDCVASVDVVHSSMTLGELQTEIQLQASVPCGRQHFIVGGDQIDSRSARSRPIGELLRLAFSDSRAVAV